MLKRTVVITNPLNLRLRDAQIVLTSKERPEIENTVPIEDVGILMIENHFASISLPLINALVDNNVSVIICDEKYMPNALIVGLNVNNTQSEVYEYQINATEPLKKNLWKQVIEHKIRNQAGVLSKLGKESDILKPYYSNVRSGDVDNREGVAAKVYWKALFGNSFVRSREGASPNNMLNYGYMILRAAVARALVGSGLMLALGIHHGNKYNAFPLADDIMEPFRPYVDELVYEIFTSGEMELTKEVKAHLLKVLVVDTEFNSIKRPLEVGLSFTTASLAKCIMGKQKTLSYPKI